MCVILGLSAIYRQVNMLAFKINVNFFFFIVSSFPIRKVSLPSRFLHFLYLQAFTHSLPLQDHWFPWWLLPVLKSDMKEHPHLILLSFKIFTPSKFFKIFLLSKFLLLSESLGKHFYTFLDGTRRVLTGPVLPSDSCRVHPHIFFLLFSLN